MQKSRASFTVFFEDPFWVGVYEREEPGGLTACRVVFGAEPKDGEIYEWMLQNWAQLHFGPPLADARRPRAENPKRARRMARRSLAVQGVGTKAQQALALARGAGKQARTAARREQEQADRERRFALRVQRRKEKHRGRSLPAPVLFFLFLLFQFKLASGLRFLFLSADRLPACLYLLMLQFQGLLGFGTHA